MDEKPDTEQTNPFIRSEDFEERYSNNVQFEPSAWDLKLLFGQLDQSAGAEATVVRQHTSMTITWVQAKILSYFLQVNIRAHEIDNGRIVVPTRVLPPDPEALPLEEADENATAMRHEMLRLRAELL